MAKVVVRMEKRPNNDLVTCDSLPKLNFEAWRDVNRNKQ